MGLVSAALLLAAIGVGAQPETGAGPSADGFRVENAVYFGDEVQPTSQSTTIFSGGVVYDCMKTPAETVVFEPWAGRFVLLSEKHHCRTELTTTDVADGSFAANRGEKFRSAGEVSGRAEVQGGV